jgi:tripartite-type tricarboxylate transporter receptor subunit TctC
MNYQLVALAFAFMLGALVPTASVCGEYPSRPVRLVVGFLPGAPADLLARVLAPALKKYFDYPVIIDSHPGGSGNLAAARVAQAPPDGHTLLLVSETFATSVSIFSNLDYNPQRNFEPVARVAQYHNVLAVNTASRIKTLADLLSMIRAQPGHVAIASSGTGSASHLAAELMKVRAGWLNALHVPYRGDRFALAGLLGTHVHAHFATIASAHPHIRTGRLQGLGVTSLRRSRLLPDVPTFDESGFPGFEAIPWNGVVAPAGTSYDTVVRISVALAQVIGAPMVRERFAAQGADLITDTPEQFTEYLRREVERWGKVVKASGFSIE